MKLVININNLSKEGWEDIKAFIDIQFSIVRDCKNGIYSKGPYDFKIEANEYYVNKIEIKDVKCNAK